MQPLLIGNIGKGLKLDRTAFVINNDAFPTLMNFYTWRGRVKKKRGTVYVGQLQLQGQMASVPNVWQVAPITLSGGAGTLPNTSIVPGSITFTTVQVGTISAITQASSAVVTVTGTYAIGETIFISGVVGMTQINGASYVITATGAGTITINVNSTGFSAYVSGGFVYLNLNTYIEPTTPDGTLLQSGPQATAITGITQASSAVVTIAGSTYSIGNVVYITGVAGMTQINNAYYTVTATGINTITINVDSTAFTAYVSGGNAYLANQGTVNYATGAVTIVGGNSFNLTGFFSYYPALPVMGLKDFVSITASTSSTDDTADYPLLIAFDTEKAYQINQNNVMNFFYNISFYKYTNIPVTWTGEDYQQFWTTNYSGAFWATNNVPGFQFKNLTNTLVGDTLSVVDVTATQVTVGLMAHGLTDGDYIYFNEVTGSIGSSTTPNQNINGQTGIVTVVNANELTVNFTGLNGSSLSNFGGGTTGTGGIAQYLTDTVSGNGDGIRWYDGDPTPGANGGTGLPTGTGKGWVNFSPPLSKGPIIIGNMTPAIYYLVGALAIVPFKDRLLFISPWVMTSGQTIGSAVQLSDTILWNGPGTPFYANPVPINNIADSTAYYEDLTGRGGNLPAGISQSITSINNNEDVLLIGFSNRQTRFAFTGDQINPFLFFSINSELGSLSLFSSVTVDRGGYALGNHGITLTTQTETMRIDLDIPDTIFAINNLNNGVERVNSVRDFFNEWIYFTYPNDQDNWNYPNQTLLFNYRDNTWAIQKESYTAQGTFRKSESLTWAVVGQVFATWNDWREPWYSPTTNALFPTAIGGNAQGFVVERATGTGEARSRMITAIGTDANGNTQITSPNNCLDNGDYIYFQGALGASYLNGLIGRVLLSNPDAGTFSVDIPYQMSTYLGLGTFALLTLPFLQTKQFPMFWEQGRQVRLGFQQYLFDRTVEGQVTLYIYLSQDSDNPYNAGTIVPPGMDDPDPENNSLIYSQIVFTSPEPYTQSVINGSLGVVGNNVATTITLNLQDLLGFGTPIVPETVLINIGNPPLATFTDNGTGGFTVTGTGVSSGSSIDYGTGITTLVFSIAPLSFSTANLQYLVDNIQSPTARSQNQIWHRMNTSLIGDTVQIGFTLSDKQMKNLEIATSEITLHMIQINCSPGPYLS